MLIDAHCHFFTNKVLVERLQKDTKSLLRLSKHLNTNDNLIVQGATQFLSTSANNTPNDMYNYMKNCYGCDFIAVPLMMDLTYAFVAPEHKKKQKAQIKKELEKEKGSGWTKYFASIEDKLNTFERSALGFTVFKNSYQQQIEELVNLKNLMPKRVYPFFSIDPRRNNQFEGGILSEIKRYVGKDKPFLGVKLYSSLGYSPTHPALYDNSESESVYGYCQKHKIPITVHASIEGFSHFLDKTHIEGDVYYPDAGRCVPAEVLYKEGIVKYDKNIPTINFDDVTRERLILLNHPVLWRKVLNKYPKLKINFAHFGGVIQMYKYSNHDKSAFWPKYIEEMLNDFPNVYTDLSCYYEQDNNTDYMKLIYENMYKKLSNKARRKVMFGSDYYMLALYNTSPEKYIKNFRDAFGKEFRNISEKNPRRFLRI